VYKGVLKKETDPATVVKSDNRESYSLRELLDSSKDVTVQVSTAVNVVNAIFWDWRSVALVRKRIRKI
jgi:hypothetical protein